MTHINDFQILKSLEKELRVSLVEYQQDVDLWEVAPGYIKEKEKVVALTLNRIIKGKIPNSLTLLANLEVLFLAYNDLSDISALRTLSKLTSLHLGKNKLTDFSVLSELSNLKDLKLWGNELTDISSLSELSSLELLLLNNNKLTDISALSGLKNLKTLILWGNRLTDASPLSGLEKLTVLDLKNNQITDFSPLSGLEKLTGLYLENNQITDFSFINRLKNLTTLKLYNNQLVDISSLSALKNLARLDLGNNQLVDISSLSGLKNLTTLELNNNQLADVSPLSGLKNLKKLNLWGNRLTDVSPLNGLKNLERLGLSNNQFVDISSLSGLKNLTTLELSNNQLGNISALSGLKNLTTLELSNNQLVDISPLSGLINLITLELSNNQITDILTIKKLSNLFKLDLSNNSIKTIPQWIVESEMELISHDEFYPSGFSIVNNPIENVPLEIVTQSKEAIRDYIVSLEEGSQPINEIKVILLGEGAVGKTSLMNYMLGRPYNKNQSQTHGINLEECKAGTGVTMKVWDFGGQDIMHHTHQFFLTQKSVYVLVLNARENNDTEKWLKLIQVFGGDSPVIIVTNKIDENPSDHENIKYLNTKYPNINDRYVRISCKNDIGLGEFRMLLTNTIKDLLHVRTIWGNSWLKVKNELESMRDGECLKDYIHYDKYDEICEKYGVAKTHRDTLINWLHQLGVVTYFADTNLNETNVINPSWLTGAFYKIINARFVADAFGRFNLSQLPQILDGNKYPERKYGFLLGLMTKFELCYQIDSTTYLLPDLLKKEEPDFAFSFEDSLKFKFKYSKLLPKSILPKVMVRRHEEIKDDCKWRTGLLIEDIHYESEAIVRADEEDKEITIYTRGQERRGYLASIISNIEDINKMFEGLEYEKLVPCCCTRCKGNKNPHYFKYDVLMKSRSKGRVNYICEISDEDVPINVLLGVLITSDELNETIIELVGKGTFKTKNILKRGK